MPKLVDGVWSKVTPFISKCLISKPIVIFCFLFCFRILIHDQMRIPYPVDSNIENFIYCKPLFFSITYRGRAALPNKIDQSRIERKVNTKGFMHSNQPLTILTPLPHSNAFEKVIHACSSQRAPFNMAVKLGLCFEIYHNYSAIHRI